MENSATFEQVKAAVQQLPWLERLRLAAWICLEDAGEPYRRSATAIPWEGRLRQKEADAFEAIVDAVSDLSEFEFDAAREIRQMREERDEQICPGLRNPRRKPHQ